MKKKLLSLSLTAIFALSMLLNPNTAMAQDDSESKFSLGADLVSSYIWRGTQFGNSPAVQPYLELGLGNFSIGGWGSYDFNGFAEADLYLSYGFDFGLSIGVTDYYYPGTPYFDYSTATGAHGFEINLGYEIGGLGLSANYMLNEAGNAGTAGGDMYFEAAYSFEHFGIHVGAGNGWHTVENPLDADESDFNVCNIGISSSREIKITDSYSLPLSGAVILNPDTEQFHVVLGVSF